MSTQVAGVLIDPFERPLANTDIDIRAITNTFAVLPGNTIKVTTNDQGEYNFILEPANYAVSVIIGGRAVYQGAIAVTSTTAGGTLPQLLKQAEMEAELPLNYSEYFRQVQASVKDDADRASAAADSIGDQLDQAQAAASSAQASANSSEQSNQQSQAAAQAAQTIADKFTNLDDAVNQTQQNAQKTQADAQQTNADKAAAEAAAQRAENAADSAESVNERNIRVPQNETINALPSASQRANSFPVFDNQGQSAVRLLSSVAPLDASGKVPLANIPAAAITEVFPVSSQAEMLALTAEPGDVAIINNTTTPSQSGSYILMSSPASTLENWQALTNDVLVQLASPSGASKIGYKPPFTNSVAATLDVFLGEVCSVKRWGAKGDGVTDDTFTIQAAVDWTSANGRSLYFPDGTYLTERVHIKPHTRMFGNGRSSIIKRRSDNNLDLLYGVNSAAMWGSTDTNATNFAYDVEIHDLYLDGGVDGVTIPFSTTRYGSGIAIWGHNNRFYNLDILNCAEMGIRTEGYDNNIDFGTVWQEASFYSIRIRNVGAHGWQFDGPHDSKFVDISIINASQRGDNQYDGMITGKQGTGDFSGLHISVSGNNTNNSDNLRHRYSLNLNTSCRFSGGTSIEGARIPLRIGAGNSQFDGSCTYYAAWGSGSDAITIKMEGQCGLNVIRGTINGSESFRTGLNQYGIVFGTASGDSVNNNIIDVAINGCNIPISFGASTTAPDGDKGNNIIKIVSYYGGKKTPVGTYGFPNTANGTEIDFKMSGAQTIRSLSMRQTKSVTVAANSSYTWNFRYPFQGTPVISSTIANPGTTPSGNIWLSGKGSTSCTIFNGTGTSITVDMTASKAVQE